MDIEIFGVLFIIGWVGLIVIPYFFLMNALGIFRVDAIEEEVGLDIAHHKGSAYDLTEYDESSPIADKYIPLQLQTRKC